MKRNLLLSISAFLALTAFLISGCEPSVTEEETNTEKVESKADASDKGDESYHQGHGSLGFIYKTSDPSITVEVGVDSEKDIVTLILRDKDMKEENPHAIEKLTVVTSGKKTREFSLTPPDVSEGKAAKFTAEDPQLVIVMSGRCWIKFDLDGKEIKSWVFPHGAH